MDVVTQDEIDARRYRWLRDEAPDTWEVTEWINNETQEIHYDDGLDAAIDAAMADEPRYTITAKGREMLEGK